MMPVTAAALKFALIRIQKSGRFRQTVERLGNLRVCMHPAKGRGIPLFSGVSQDDDYAYFTLKDGTILKLSKSKELKCEILSGKQYFANGEEKLISVEMSGISRYTVTKA